MGGDSNKYYVMFRIKRDKVEIVTQNCDVKENEKPMITSEECSSVVCSSKRKDFSIIHMIGDLFRQCQLHATYSIVPSN